MTEEALFAQAIELPPTERSAFLNEACADDSEMRERIEILLRSHDETGTFLAEAALIDFDAPTIGPGGELSGKAHTPIIPTPSASQPGGSEAAANALTEIAGDVIGPFTLLEKLGEGGFGTVWKAEQSVPFDRTVALKIIKLGMDTREVLTRFEAERQALAMMNHENIAKVLDAGATKNGRPYFVMELVDGVSITKYCDEQQLDTRQRLSLFRDVCAAVNHAHQKGMIHRDIKPSNVMVTEQDDKPVVKVIDFGIAKATEGKLTEETLVTLQEQVIGTPAYMSPEQAGMDGLDIDTRSDIYSLGVLLYELLSGKPPFDPKTLMSAGFDEMRRIVREDEPPRPSNRVSTISDAEATVNITTTHGVEPHRLSRILRGDLDWIVMKALSKERERRYETANAFAEDIERFLGDEPVQAAAPSAAYKFQKFARRNKAAIGTAALITAILIASTAVSTWQAIEAHRARMEAERHSGELVRTLTTLAQSFDSLENYEGAVSLWQVLVSTLREKYGPQHPETLTAMGNLARSYYAAGRLDDAIKMLEWLDELQSKIFGSEHPSTLETRAKIQGWINEGNKVSGSERRLPPVSGNVLESEPSIHPGPAETEKTNKPDKPISESTPSIKDATSNSPDEVPRVVANKAKLKFKHDRFTFVRLKYNSGTWMGRKAKWMIDYPDADKNFSAHLEKVTGLKASKELKVLELTDPKLKDSPFLYLVEPGEIRLAEDEVKILRDYLLDGGFIMMDDFWGTQEWNHLRTMMKKVFPNRDPVDLPISHPVFRSFYEIHEKPQVPALGISMMNQQEPGKHYEWSKPGSETPHYWGLSDDNGRLMAILCHNTDLGDGWESEGEDRYYDKEFTFKKAYPMGVNIVVHALRDSTDEE